MEMKSLLRANLDRVLAVVAVIAGLVALLIGWIGTSGTGLAAEQNPYLISGGLFGIALIGIGCTMWVSADLQDEWRRLDRLQESFDAAFSRPGDPVPEDGRLHDETLSSADTGVIAIDNPERTGPRRRPLQAEPLSASVDR